MSKGPEALADYELLAILLRTGIQGEDVLRFSRRLLQDLGGLRGLHKADQQQLLAIRGIKTGKAATLMAAAELGRRFSKMLRTPDDRPRIRNAEDVYELLQYEMAPLDHEELYVLSLDTKHFVIAEDHIYRGTVNASSVRVAEIFRSPILHNAAGIILVHNHPSGDPQPSTADIVTTRSVMEAGKNLEIPLMDHVIIGKGRYQSLRSYME